jgi:hypothetical protein
MQLQRQLQLTPEGMYPTQQQGFLLQLTVQRPGLVTVLPTVLQAVQGYGKKKMKKSLEPSLLNEKNEDFPL